MCGGTGTFGSLVRFAAYLLIVRTDDHRHRQHRGHGQRPIGRGAQRCHGKHLPLFVFVAGSPFFLKNFMHTLGHFDIYGCLFAIVLLLIPMRSLVYVLLAAAFSAVLVLIHHVHLLMYVPTIAAIVVLRYYLVQDVSRQNVAVGIALLAAIGALFVAAQFYGTMAVPEPEFTAYLRSRMADPSRNDLLSFAYIWYQPLAREVSDTWERLPYNLLGVPVFALLIWLHTPLWKYFRDLITALGVEHIATSSPPRS